ncbi:MAG: ADOP family duplicated permease, partial [Gemmatimonadota bacterium]|nr:ADOP family duplicated permease [Gemmatimonadota bacterium]
ENADAFERVAGFRFTDFTLSTVEGPERLIGGVVTPGWLATLGVRPAHGRGFTADEESAGRSSRVAVVGDGLARSRFGTPEAAVGSTLRLNGTPHDIVGVLPEGFAYPYSAQVWVPFRPDIGVQDGSWALNIQGRLAPGRSLAAAADQLGALSDRAGAETPGLAGMTLVARPLEQTLIDRQGRTAAALLAAVGLLLLVACANLANLLLGRALARDTEFAIRSSLGASRRRLLTQTMVESLVLGAAGCAAGVGLAGLGVGLLAPLVPEDLATLGATPTVDGGTLAFAVGLALLTAVVLGLVPAVRASATRPALAMRRGRSGALSRGAKGLGRGFVVAELAVTLMLLTGVGLMIRDLSRLQSLELGYEPSDILLFSIALDREPYLTGDARVQLADRLLSELAATPGIGAASLTTMFPRHRGNTLSEIEEEGRDPSQPGVPINNRLVTPGFLETVGARVIRGRGIETTDRAGGPPVALVSTSLAELLWPGEEPIGRRLRDRRAGDDGWVTVVGVVNDVLQADDIRHTWYLPYAQGADLRVAGQATIVTRGEPGGGPPTLSTVRAALGRVDPELPPFEVVSATTLNFEALARERFGTRLGTLFAAFGLLLATLGVYGSISYTVTRRTREFGVRLALGSDGRRIVRSVLGDLGGVLAVGLALGLLGSLAVARALGSVLAGTEGFDLVPFMIAGIVLSATAGGAAVIPALRASRVDPVRALRAE